MARQDFAKPVKVEIIKRATVNGVVYCEGCGAQAKRFDIDHTIPDAMRTDKSRKLTSADGKLLCSGGKDTCHGKKTPDDVAKIAKAKRREARHLGVKTEPAKKLEGPSFPAPPVKDRSASDKTRLGIGGKWVFGAFYPD